MAVRIVYVVGYPRSGSTLLSMLLAAVFDGAFVGELQFLYDRWERARRCGCGRPVPVCPVWQEVVTRMYGSPSDHRGEATAHARRLQQRATSLWHRSPAALAECRSQRSDTYGAVAKALGQDLLIDSSKRVGDATIVRLARGAEVWFIHLRRDPRGIAHSRAKGRRRRVHAGRHPSPVRARFDLLWALYDGVAWRCSELRIRRVLRRHPPNRVMTLAYAELASDPIPTMELIGDWLGNHPDLSCFHDRRTVALPPNHAVAGNTLRFRHGRTKIRFDDAWMSEMPETHQRAVMPFGPDAR